MPNVPPDGWESTIETLRGRTDPPDGGIPTRLDQLQTSIDSLTGQVTELQAAVESLTQRVAALESGA